MTTNIGFARLTAATQQFLNTCPAVLDWTATSDEYFALFRFNPAVEVSIIPCGVYFDFAAEEDEAIQFSQSLLQHEIQRLDESDMRASKEEMEALSEILAYEGFGGREAGVVTFDDAAKISIERLAWLRQQRADGLR